MTSKLAICQVADTGPLESLALMLRSAGWGVALPSRRLRDELRRIGCDTVLEVDDLVKSWGYERPQLPAEPNLKSRDFPKAGIADMSRSDVVFVDVKGHRSYEKVVKRWPNLRDRVLWYRINGGRPEHVTKKCEKCEGTGSWCSSPFPCPSCLGSGNGTDHGDEIDPPCPVLTPNQWYRVQGEREYQGQDEFGHLTINWPIPWRKGIRGGQFYVCWPPFVRFDDYRGERIGGGYFAPICLIHNAGGWGYGKLTGRFRDELGVKVHGQGSPDGLVQHREVAGLLATALAMVHLKSNDAPGYAIYECLASACPLVCTRRLIWRCRMQELLIPGETCLVFDRETHDGLTPADVESCTVEVAQHLQALRDPGYNKAIGEAGRARLLEVMWRADRDGPGLKDWLEKSFP